MVALNYARDVRIGDRPARAVALGSNFVWPTLPERLFLRGQSMVYDFVGQKYATRLSDNTIDYTTNVNDLGILTRASEATYWGPSGTLLEAAVDVARIQHDPVTGEPLGVLIEGERTNATNYSYRMTPNYGGTTVVSSIDSDVIGKFSTYTSEDGVSTELRTIPFYVFSGSENTRAVRYVAFRKVDGSTINYASLGVFSQRVGTYATINLSTGEIVYSTSGAEVFTRDLGDGWILLGFASPLSTSFSRRGFSAWFGETADSVAVPGVQQVQYGFLQAFHTDSDTFIFDSYIPTIDSPVTRAADEVSIDLSDVFNPDEGTLRITAQVPEGGVVASLGNRHVISDSSEFKEYDLNYRSYSGNTVAQLGEGIFNKVEYFPVKQGETALEYLIRGLFGNGEQGVMYIPVPKVLGQQVLWQDVEGTIPVESDGDPVGLMLDLSGNDNHATQSVSANRPLYRTDGVLHWLEPDRVDDTMSTGGPVDLTGSPISTIFTAIRKTAGTSREVIIGSNLDLPDSVAAASPESDTRGVSSICNAANAGQAATVSGFSSETDLITSHITDFSTTNVARRYTIRVNGIARSIGSVGSGVASLSQGNLPMNLFSRPGSQYFGGRFYGAAVVSGEPLGDVVEEMESYLANLAGVTL